MSNIVSIDDDRALYLYGLTPPDVSPELDEPGVEGGETSTVAVHALHDDTPGRSVPLAAVLDTVSLDDWSGEQGREHMESLDWVAPRAVRHEEVVRAAFEQGPIYPIQFGTLFSGYDSLCNHLAERLEAIEAFLDRIDGREEWGVKAYLDRETAEAAFMEGEAATDDEPDSGTAYLQQRARQQERCEEARDALHEWLDDVEREALEAFGEVAVERARLARREGADARRDGELTFNWSFLVERGRASHVEDLVERWNERVDDRGLTFECSGPWPPFSFRPDDDANATSNTVR